MTAERTCTAQAQAAVCVLGIALLACSAREPGPPIHFEASGRILEAKTHRPLRGASVSIKDTQVGAVTDSLGTYSLSGVAPSGRHTLVVQLIGYGIQRRRIRVGQTGPIAVPDVRLGEVAIRLDDLVVGIEKCSWHRTAPSDTIGARVILEPDSPVTVWRVCRPVEIRE
jgi:carboxypeptidase-like protein